MKINVNKKINKIVEQEKTALQIKLAAYFIHNPQTNEIVFPPSKPVTVNLKGEDISSSVDTDKIPYYNPFYIQYGIHSILFDRKTKEYILRVYLFEDGYGDNHETWDKILSETEFITGELTKVFNAIQL